MESLKKLYKIGRGPSSSHTMGPSNATEAFRKEHMDAASYEIILYGSLALTGKGHFIEEAITEVLKGCDFVITYDYETNYDYHPNGMKLIAYDEKHNIIADKLVFSVGGGRVLPYGAPIDSFDENIYPEKSMEEVIKYCKSNNINFVDYVIKHEDKDIMSYLKDVMIRMLGIATVGMQTEGILPGGLNTRRKAPEYFKDFLKTGDFSTCVFAAALGASEMNASSGVVVTAPTCGSCGVIPGILFAEKTCNRVSDDELIKALMVGGVIGNIIKTNGSISGAEVGCQGEIGVACAMASGMVAYLKGGTINEIEYAAEIALEHHLGMTCDPIDGLVQIPCIERNAIAAMQAYNSANYSILSKGMHLISFDDVVRVMTKTGKDLQAAYRETSLGGLAAKK